MKDIAIIVMGLVGSVFGTYASLVDISLFEEDH